MLQRDTTYVGPDGVGATLTTLHGGNASVLTEQLVSVLSHKNICRTIYLVVNTARLPALRAADALPASHWTSKLPAVPTHTEQSSSYPAMAPYLCYKYGSIQQWYFICVSCYLSRHL